MTEPITRRRALQRTSWLATSFAAGIPIGTGTSSAAEPGSSTALRPFKVIVTGGHPGDPEYGCGGTVARYTDLGHEVILLYLNEGEPPDQPQRQPHGTRVAEAKHACEILKARPAFAGQVDGRAIVDASHYEQFRRLLESEQPDVVFTHWPLDNHADHRAISMLVYESFLRMGKRFALYYYEVSNGEDTVQFAPTHYVDISKAEPRKRAACFAHASQSPERFYALQERVALWRGIESGFGQAESYIRHVQSRDGVLPP